MPIPHGELVIDLDAIVDNWRTIKKNLSSSCQCGAVVKANAYGLGVDQVAPVLYRAGCTSFFVANLAEARALSSALIHDVEIFVLSGCRPGEEKEFIRRAFTPILISYEMYERWVSACEKHDSAVRSVVKFNTGMGRLGMDTSELERLLSRPESLSVAGVRMVMSHLACADDQQHSLNAQQIQSFAKIVERFRSFIPALRASLANSAGVYLGSQGHWDMVRPGIALFGGNPFANKSNPMRSVATLHLPIIQIRNLSHGDAVGYGATKTFEKNARVAVVAGGYADGILRSLSNCGSGFLKGARVPIVGRVSMDTTIFDISSVDDEVVLGDSIELLGKNNSIDKLARDAGTISYEILTSLGDRYKRRYVGGLDFSDCGKSGKEG